METRAMTSWPKAFEVKSYYGDPDPHHEGVADRRWEMDSLERITPPYRMTLAWAPMKRLNSITVHKKCASSLLMILNRISLHFGSEQLIEANRMHLYGGCYNFRLMRGSTKLSNHAYGAAIDLDPEANYLGRQYSEGVGMVPMAVVKIFEDEGWTWGGHWERPDCQHFEAVQRS
jgi:hypothetical protein